MPRWEWKMVELSLKTVWQVFKKVKGLSHDSAIPLLNGEMKTY